MSTTHIGNVTVNFSRKNNNDIVADKYAKSKHVDEIADKIIERIGNPQYRAFYCKVAWKLSEARIWNHIESATKANPAAPGKLFSYLCKRDGV